jgi:hypothetical protein
MNSRPKSADIAIGQHRLDDVQRNAEGVDRAIHEFLRDYPTWMMPPIFPSQGLLIPKSWFG